jgi:Fur family ferric uptake transcriptional regulator
VTTPAQVGLGLEELLQRSDVRVTRQRVSVLEELAREENDATAQQLFERLRARNVPVGLATVYRALALLHERGVIDALAHHSGELCYRLCGEHHHHHLMCSSCHRVVELQDCTLDEWVTRSAARHGFTATSHQVEIVGTCADCRGFDAGATS